MAGSWSLSFPDPSWVITHTVLDKLGFLISKAAQGRALHKLPQVASLRQS